MNHIKIVSDKNVHYFIHAMSCTMYHFGTHLVVNLCKIINATIVFEVVDLISL